MTNHTPARLAELFVRRPDSNQSAADFLTSYPEARITHDQLMALAEPRAAELRVSNREHVQTELARVHAALSGEPGPKPERYGLCRIGDRVGERLPATPAYLADLRVRLEAF